MKKKIGLLGLVVVMVILGTMVASAYSPITYFTENVITTSNLDVQLNERIVTPENELVDAEDAYYENMVPGEDVNTVYTIENVGTMDMYVRVKFEMDVKSADGKKIVNDELLVLSVASDEWVLDEDGWYRYTGIVEANQGELMTPFYSELLPISVGNEYEGATVVINAIVQAVQVDNNEYDITTESILDVVGWPMESILGF